MMRAIFSLLVLCLVTCVGCGGPDYGSPVAVKGKVTVGGQPPKDVRIIFQANDSKLTAEKRYVMSPVGTDGTFKMDKVYPADYVVMLESTLPPPMDPGSASANPTAVVGVDEKGQAKTLTAKVPTGTNEFTFDF